jgi:1-deoxy-D-xylulose-5-phosphate synthase
MLYTACTLDTPSAVRYPRGTGPGARIVKQMQALPVGKGVVRRTGKRAALLAFGSMVHPAIAAANDLDATAVDMRFVKPIDLDLIRQMAQSHELIVTVEEHQVMGGAGSAVCEALAALKIEKPVLLLGLPDRFIDHGDPAKLLASVGLDAEGIRASIKKAMPD